MKKATLALIFVLVSMSMYAQTGTVKGVITDGSEPLPAATVIVQGTSLGAFSDDETGTFTIENVPVGKCTLLVRVISFNELIVTNVEIRKGEVTDLGKLKLTPEDGGDNTVVIKGSFKEGDAKAMHLTQVSPRIVNIISSNSVGKLPDRNAAEAVQRVPAVALERDQGEGRFISVRGTPTDWSSSLVNGDRLPVADENGDSRTLAFDIFPSDLIQYIELSKALTPDQEGDAIGGSVNFITKTAPQDRTLNVSLGGGYNFQAEKALGSGSFMWGDRTKDGKFGYLVSGSLYQRNYGTDNYEVIYGSNYNHALSRMELRDYVGYRRTIGINLAAEYNIAEGAKIYFKGLHGNFYDNERNYKTMYNWAVGAGQTVRLQNIHNIMETRLFGGEIGTNLKLGDRIKLDAKIARYENSFGYGPVPFGRGDERNGYHVVQFERFNVQYLDMIFVDQDGNPVDDPDGAFRVKLIGDDHPYGGDDPENIQPIIDVELQPGDFEFTGAYSELNETWEKDPIVAKLDLNYIANENLNLKVGGKMRMKEGSRRISLHEWFQDISVTSDPYYLTSFETSEMNTNGGFLAEIGSPYEGTFMPFLSDSQMANIIPEFGDTLWEREMNSQHPHYEEWVGSRYTYQENVFAGYGMATWKISDKLQFIGGVRAEQTQLTMQADTVLEGYFNLDSLRYIYPVEEVSSKSEYLSILPMVHFKYSPVKNSNIRVAATRTMRRPNFNETKPGSPVKDFTNLEFNLGNRELKPSYSWNFDLMGEYFFKNVGLVSAGLFYKHIEDHIFATITADADPRTGIIFKSFDNADNSQLFGAECSVNRRFDFLPGFLSGFGVNGNYTFTHSQMQVPGRPELQPLPRQAKHLYNIALFYENDSIGLNVRLALNYKGPYLMELNLAAVQDSSDTIELLHKDTDFDVFMDEFTSLDLSVNYKLSKHITLFAEANNLLNAPFRIYRGKRGRPMQTEYYSIRGLVGIRLSAF